MERTKHKNSVKTFTKGNLSSIRADINEALETVKNKHGFNSIRLGNISFTEFEFRASLTATLTSKEATESKKAQQMLLCQMLGIPEDTIGKQILIRGMICVITDIKPRNRQYPVIATAPSGSSYKLSIVQTKSLLK